MSFPPEGYSIIPERDRQRAIDVLAAADRAGVDQYEVKKLAEGYLVPTAVAEEFDAASKAAKKARKAAKAAETVEVVGEPVTENEAGSTPAAVVEGLTAGEDGLQTLPVADVVEPVEPVVVEPVAEPVVVEAPRKSGSKADWAAYAAEHKGYDASEDLSRDQLVERYGEKE